MTDVTCLPRPPPVSQCDRNQLGPSRSTGTVCVAGGGAHVGYAIRYIHSHYLLWSDLEKVLVDSDLMVLLTFASVSLLVRVN